MTPSKRLDQIEPVLADVAQKTDRLIESNGQIFELASKNNAIIELTARGLADLTLTVNKRFESVDRRFDTMDMRFESVDRRFDTMDTRFEGIDRRLDDQGNGIQELKINVVELKQGQSRIEDSQQQILTILRERLK